MGSSAWSICQQVSNLLIYLQKLSQEDLEQQITKLGMINQPNLRETIGS